MIQSEIDRKLIDGLLGRFSLVPIDGMISENHFIARDAIMSQMSYFLIEAARHGVRQKEIAAFAVKWI